MGKIKNNTDWDNCAIEHFKLGAAEMKAEILTRFDAYVWASYDLLHSEVDKRLVSDLKAIRNLIKNAEVNDGQ